MLRKNLDSLVKKKIQKKEGPCHMGRKRSRKGVGGSQKTRKGEKGLLSKPTHVINELGWKKGRVCKRSGWGGPSPGWEKRVGPKAPIVAEVTPWVVVPPSFLGRKT